MPNIYGISQEIGTYKIVDYLMNATHPDCDFADNKYIVGPPNDSMWVNLSASDSIQGNFGMAWIDGLGPDIIIQSAYNRGTHVVNLVLSDGTLSSSAVISNNQWIYIDDIIQWNYAFKGSSDCKSNSLQGAYYLGILDFQEDFDLLEDDIVVGIKIKFQSFPQDPDISGVFITSYAKECNLIDLGDDFFICSKDTLYIDIGDFENLKWGENSIGNRLVLDSENLSLGYNEIIVQGLDSANGCKSIDTLGVTVDRCLQFNEDSHCPNLVLYPNPVETVINLEFSILEEENTIKIFTYRGKLMEEFHNTPKELAIDLTGYLPGLYLLKSQKSICKFIKH